MSEIYIEELAKEKDWDFVIENSSQSTFFSEKIFLEATGKKFLRLIIKKGSIIKAGISFFLSDDKKKIIDNYLGIYGGLLFVDNTESKLYRKNTDIFNITNVLVDFLTKEYDEISIKTFPSFQDLRPFQWYNYNTNLPKFEINIRYTLILNGKSLDEIKSGFSTNHNRSIAKAIKNNYKSEISNDPKILFQHYENLVKINNIEITAKEKMELKNTCKAILKKNRGIILYIKNDKNVILSSIFYVWDNKRSYFLIGARNVEADDIFAPTYSHWLMIKYLFENNNLKQFDFEGVNSPKRGLFKLKFGGSLHPYYHLILKKRV